MFSQAKISDTLPAYIADLEIIHEFTNTGIDYRVRVQSPNTFYVEGELSTGKYIYFTSNRIPDVAPPPNPAINADDITTGTLNVNRLQFASNSLIANLTNSAASPTEITISDTGFITYTGTPTFTATTDPSGTTTKYYRVFRLLNFCELMIWLRYGTGGNTVTTVIMPWPSLAQLPSEPTNYTTNGDFLYSAKGFITGEQSFPAGTQNAVVIKTGTNTYTCRITTNVGNAARNIFFSCSYFCQ